MYQYIKVPTHLKVVKGSAYLSVSSKFKSNTGPIVRVRLK